MASDVLRLSTLLTKDRSNLPASYLKDRGLRSAYVAYFLPANRHKISVPLKELSIHPKKPLEKSRLRVLDIGSGPGTAVLGALDFFSSWETAPVLEFIAVDSVAENLRDAESLFNSYVKDNCIKASLVTIKSGIENVESNVSGSYDIIILSNILNEVVSADIDRAAKRAALLKRITGRLLTNDGCCIIIEPSLRETSRDLLEVRDILSEAGLHIYSPCLTCGKCPVLANPKDWCHEDLQWTPPSIVKELDRLTGLRKDSLKFSYLVLRKDNLSLSDIHGTDSYRIVSEPLVSKGKIEFYLCGAAGRRLIVRLDKDKTPFNHPFQELVRGDVVAFENLADEEKRLRVTKDTAVVVKNRIVLSA